MGNYPQPKNVSIPVQMRRIDPERFTCKQTVAAAVYLPFESNYNYYAVSID